MATRKKGMGAIPALYSQGKNVFPVTAFRSRLAVSTFTTAGNQKATVELDLQFEDNEVLDIISVDTIMEWGLTQELAVDTDLVAYQGLFEDPDKAVLTDLSLEATFEDDTSLIHFDESGVVYDFGDATGETIWTSVSRNYFTFPQPYTVARNVCLILQGDGVEGDAVNLVTRTTIWGRRRNATDAEFKNIVYRQRF